jgi:hypothetical protein
LIVGLLCGLLWEVPANTEGVVFDSLCGIGVPDDVDIDVDIDVDADVNADVDVDVVIDVAREVVKAEVGDGELVTKVAVLVLMSGSCGTATCVNVVLGPGVSGSVANSERSWLRHRI